MTLPRPVRDLSSDDDGGGVIVIACLLFVLECEGGKIILKCGANFLLLYFSENHKVFFASKEATCVCLLRALLWLFRSPWIQFAKLFYWTLPYGWNRSIGNCLVFTQKKWGKPLFPSKACSFFYSKGMLFSWNFQKNASEGNAFFSRKVYMWVLKN